MESWHGMQGGTKNGWHAQVTLRKKIVSIELIYINSTAKGISQRFVYIVGEEIVNVSQHMLFFLCSS
jgi:hypothetical protein